MNEKRSQPAYCVPSSLNELQRKREVDRMNFENNLILGRLNHIAPTLSNAEFKEDFEKHLKAEAHLRRRQMKPLALPKDMMRVKEKSSLFDASTYASQHDSFGGASSGILDEFESPIKSMKEFRQHVIATKKMSDSNHTRSQLQQSSSTSGSHADGTGGANTLLKSQREVSVHRNEPLFEMSHAPS